MFSYLLVICAKELLVCDVLVFWLERLKNLNSKPGCPNGVGDDEGDVVGYDGGIVSEYSDEMGLGLEMG